MQLDTTPGEIGGGVQVALAVGLVGREFAVVVTVSHHVNGQFVLDTRVNQQGGRGGRIGAQYEEMEFLAGRRFLCFGDDVLYGGESTGVAASGIGFSAPSGWKRIRQLHQREDFLVHLLALALPVGETGFFPRPTH